MNTPARWLSRPFSINNTFLPALVIHWCGIRKPQDMILSNAWKAGLYSLRVSAVTILICRSTPDAALRSIIQFARGLLPTMGITMATAGIMVEEKGRVGEKMEERDLATAGEDKGRG